MVYNAELALWLMRRPVDDCFDLAVLDDVAGFGRHTWMRRACTIPLVMEFNVVLLELAENLVSCSKMLRAAVF